MIVEWEKNDKQLTMKLVTGQWYSSYYCTLKFVCNR